MELAGPPRDTGAHPVIGALPDGRLRRVAAHISPYHFARLFRRATGLSPHRFILQRRIAAAAVLLADSTSSIRSVARTMGFTTASHFATTFRRVTGVTPTAYRRSRGLGNIAADMSPAATSTAGASASPCSGDQL